MSRRLLAVSLGAALGLAALPAAGAAPDSKRDLTPASFAKVHALIRPQKNEWRHLQVRWLTDVVAARKKAAAEDKPIIAPERGTQDEPHARPKKKAAKAKTEATPKPEAKPDPKAKTAAAKKPEPKSTKQ